MYEYGVPLVTCRGSNSGMVLWADGPLWVSNNAMAIWPKRGNPRFLYYALTYNPPFAVVTGSAQPQITRRDLSTFFIPWAEKRIQDEIAALLDMFDDKIELNRRMNETLEAMARAIFKDWFVDFGPTRAKMEGRAPYLAPDLWNLFPARLDPDTGLPEGWEIGTLADVAEPERRTVNPADMPGGTPYIGLEHMPRRCIALAEWDSSNEVSSNKSVFEAGDFLFGKLRPYFHKVGIAPVDGICSTDIVVLRSSRPHWQAFVLACISSEDFVAYTDQTSTGTKMPRTSWKTMSRYELCIPDDQIAEQFQAIVAPMLDRIARNIHESRTLAQTRDLLLPKLMSGEISVSLPDNECIETVLAQ